MKESTALDRTPQPGPPRWLLSAAIAVAVATTCAAGAPAPSPPQPSPASERITALWRGLTADLAPTLTASQRVLLGDRNPNGPSCVRFVRTKTVAFSSKGGAGTRLAHQWLTSAPARQSPMADFTWQQTTLRALLEDIGKRNQEILPRAVRLADVAEQLAQTLRDTSPAPGALAASTAAQHTWPGYCAAGLASALDRGDVDAARGWADELAAATFALTDLHRWLDFLARNYLATLGFQARGKSLYESSNQAYTGEFAMHPNLSCLPGGRAATSIAPNLIEVEHQAEWLFRVPPQYLTQRLDGTPVPKRDAVREVSAAVWMPPHLRSPFVRLRGSLSPAARALWDQAAHASFDRSYLVNMLYRSTTAGVLDQLAVVLTRYSQANPQPARHGLMDVLFYRGGDPAGGSDWAERFDPRLMDAAATLGGSDEQVVLRAQHFARALLGTVRHYGAADSLRDALDNNTFDCIDATNVIGCLYRNAGRAGFYNIRWSGGSVGHTVAAAEVTRAGAPAIVIVDALEDAQTATELWPVAYRRGHRWPPAYPGARADLYSVELYTRGLDNYIWVEGYILRGPNAGTFTRAPVPYLPPRPSPGTQRLRGRATLNLASPNNR